MTDMVARTTDCGSVKMASQYLGGTQTTKKEKYFYFSDWFLRKSAKFNSDGSALIHL